jgi:hypothetical protein
VAFAPEDVPGLTLPDSPEAAQAMEAMGMEGESMDEGSSGSMGTEGEAMDEESIGGSSGAGMEEESMDDSSGAMDDAEMP